MSAWKKLTAAIDLACGQELLPAGRRALRRRVDSGGLEELPDGGGRDLIAEACQLAADPPVAPGRVVAGHLQRESPDYWSGARPPGCPPRIGTDGTVFDTHRPSSSQPKILIMIRYRRRRDTNRDPAQHCHLAKPQVTVLVSSSEAVQGRLHGRAKQAFAGGAPSGFSRIQIAWCVGCWPTSPRPQGVPPCTYMSSLPAINAQGPKSGIAGTCGP